MALAAATAIDGRNIMQRVTEVRGQTTHTRMKQHDLVTLQHQRRVVPRNNDAAWTAAPDGPYLVDRCGAASRIQSHVGLARDQLRTGLGAVGREDDVKLFTREEEKKTPRSMPRRQVCGEVGQNLVTIAEQCHPLMAGKGGNI